MSRAASALEVSGFGLLLWGSFRLSVTFGLILTGLLLVVGAQAVDR